MSDFKNYTGLTQDEIAVYLGISRSQWSMYMSGKRSLPVESTLKLNELLKHLQKNDLMKSNSSFLEKESKVANDELKKKLLELEITLYQVNKKINKVEKNRQQLFLAMASIDFLKNQKQTETSRVALIEKRINKGLVNNSLKNLESFELKKQQIESDIEAIKKRLRDKK